VCEVGRFEALTAVKPKISGYDSMQDWVSGTNASEVPVVLFFKAGTLILDHPEYGGCKAIRNISTYQTIRLVFVLDLRLLAAGISPQKTRFSLSLDHMGFVLNEVALEQDYSSIPIFVDQHYSTMHIAHIPSCITNGIL
jgi:hypothetical protein